MAEYTLTINQDTIKRAVAESIDKDQVEATTREVIKEEFEQVFDLLNKSLYGLVTRAQVKKILGVSDTTIWRWEQKGLKQYHPAMEEGTTVLYLVKDIFEFVGVEDGQNN